MFRFQILLEINQHNSYNSSHLHFLVSCALGIFYFLRCLKLPPDVVKADKSPTAQQANTATPTSKKFDRSASMPVVGVRTLSFS